MPTPRLLIFDDGRGRRGPLTDLRAVFKLTTGAMNNRVRIEVGLGIMAGDLRVEEGLVAIRREHETDARTNNPLRRAEPITFYTGTRGAPWKPITVPGDAPLLVVNGRWSGGSPLSAESVRNFPLGHALVQPDGEVIAAHLPCDAAQSFIDRGCLLDPATPREKTSTNVLISRPWDILAALETTLRADLSLSEIPLWNRQTDATVACLGDGAIRVHPTTRIHPMVVLNSEKGPIVIGEHAIVGSFSVIAGPCYIGPHTIIQPHAHIRANTSVGEHCLVAGEISHSIIQGYSNKAHAGYLGNSLVGEWVNLGADTNVSNLKNTYGPVRVQLSPDTPPLGEDTGQSKQGPIIGDFVRTAIGTRLPTGSCYSTGTMLALSSMAPKFTPRFSFLTDGGPSDEKYDIEKFLAAARTAMARRERQMSPAVEARLRAFGAREIISDREGAAPAEPFLLE